MLSRRAFVGKLAAGAAAAACVAGVGRAGAATAQGKLDAPTGSGNGDKSQPGLKSDAAVSDTAGAGEAGTPPWDLLHPLATGSLVAHGWRLTDLSPVADGSAVLTLENKKGRAHRVHICRNDGSPQGLVYTQRFDLVVMNGGQGGLPTEEGFARAVGEVAHVLAANESRPQQGLVVAALLPHAERVRRLAASAKLR